MSRPTANRRYVRQPRRPRQATPHVEPLEARRLLSIVPLDGDWFGVVFEHAGDSTDRQTYNDLVEGSIDDGYFDASYTYYVDGDYHFDDDRLLVSRTDDGAFSMLYEGETGGVGGVDADSLIAWHRVGGSLGDGGDQWYDETTIIVRQGSQFDESDVAGIWSLHAHVPRLLPNGDADANPAFLSGELNLRSNGTFTLTSREVGPTNAKQWHGDWQVDGDGWIEIAFDRHPLGGDGDFALYGKVGQVGSVIVFADLINDDDSIATGFAGRKAGGVRADEVAGYYRLTRQAFDEFGRFDDHANILLHLNDDGTYEAYELLSGDTPGGESGELLQTGTWSVTGAGVFTTAGRSNNDFILDGSFDASLRTLQATDLTFDLDGAVGLLFGTVADEPPRDDSGDHTDDGDDAAYEPPYVDIAALEGVYGPASVAVAGDGHFVVVWTDNGADGSADVFARLFDADGVAITDAWVVNQATTGFQGRADVAFDGDGGFVVAWMSKGQDGDGYGIQARRYYADGTAATNEFRVNTVTADHQIAPSVAVNADGDHVVAWTTVDGTAATVHARRFVAGEGWGDEWTVSSGAGRAFKTDVALTDGGEFAIAWTLGSANALTGWLDAMGFGSSLNGDGSPDHLLPPIHDAASLVVQRFHSDGSANGSALVLSDEFALVGDLAIDFNDDATLAAAWVGLENLVEPVIVARSVEAGSPGDTLIVSDEHVGEGYPFIALLNDGGFAVLWSAVGGSGSPRVWARTFDEDGQPTTDPDALTFDLDGSHRFPAVAVNGSGVMAGAFVHESSDGTERSLVGLLLEIQGDSDGLLPDLEGDAAPYLGSNGLGQFVLTWTRIDETTGDLDVYAQRVNAAGQTVGAAFRVNQSRDGDQALSTVALDANGRFVVVWVTERLTGDLDIFARRFDANGVALGDEFRVNQTTLGDQDLPAVAMNADGSFVVAWTHVSDSDDVYARAFDAQGNARGGEVLVNQITDGYQYDPTVGIDATGAFVVAWASEDADLNTEIHARRFTAAGAARGPQFRVSEAGGWNDLPAIDVNADGQFVIAWSRWDDVDLEFDVMARWYDADASAENAVLVNDGIDGDNDDPSVAIDDDGNFVVTWTVLSGEADGDDWSEWFPPGAIHWRRFAAMGLALNGPTEVEHADAPAGYNAFASVADAPNDGFVLAWMSVEEDTLVSTIFTQAYEGGSDTPTLDLNAGDDREVDEGQQTDFVASIGNAPADGLQFLWDFGDDHTAIGQSVSHAWAEDGTYTVTLVVTDSASNIYTDTLTVEVNNVAPVVEPIGDMTADQGEAIFFEAVATDPGAEDTLTYRWNFGDGTQAEGRFASHVFSAPDAYTVTLTVRDDDGGVTVQTFTVNVENVAPVVEAGPNRRVRAGEAIAFAAHADDAGGDALTYEWNFGDGDESSAAAPSHAFDEPGRYTVTLTVRDGHGGVASDSFEVEVLPADAVIPAAPDAPTLDRSSDTGAENDDAITNLDNTAGRTLRFKVGGVARGALVQLRAGDEIIAEAVANGSNVTLDTAGDYDLTDGVHVVTAVQIVDGVESELSDPLILQVDSTAPTRPTAPILLEDHNGDGVVYTSNLTFVGHAEPGATVELHRDGRRLGQPVTVNPDGSWELAVKSGYGASSFTVVVTDAAGNASSTSPALNVTVEKAKAPKPGKPSLVDENGQFIDATDAGSTRPTFGGLANAHAIVRLYVDGVFVGTTQANAAGRWTLAPAADLSEGTHSVQVTQIADDPLAEESPTSQALKINVDTSAARLPAPYLRASKKDDTGVSNSDRITANNRPTIYGEGAEKGATVILENQQGEEIGRTVAKGSGKWSIVPDQPLEDGVHLLVAIQIDPAGHESLASAPLRIEIDSTAPAAAPAPDLTAASDTGVSNTDNITGTRELTFTGTAEPMAQVRLMRNGKAYGETVIADADGNWQITLPNAPRGITAWSVMQTDAAGNERTSGPALEVNVSTKKPAKVGPMSLSGPTDTGRSNTDGITRDPTPMILGSGIAGHTITLYATDGTTVLATTTVDDDGEWRILLGQNLSEGVHSLRATQTDAVGNESAFGKPLKFTVDRTAARLDRPEISSKKGNDTGRSDEDGITANATLTIGGAGAEKSAVIIVFDAQGDEVGRTTARNNGSWSLSFETPLDDGDHGFRVAQEDVAGNRSAPSNTLSITVDTTAPAKPTAPDLAPDSDDGESSGDNRTTRRDLTFTGLAEAFALVDLYRDGRFAGQATAGADGRWSIAVTNVPLGTSLWTVMLTDEAGNESPLSAALEVIVEVI